MIVHVRDTEKVLSDEEPTSVTIDPKKLAKVQNSYVKHMLYKDAHLRSIQSELSIALQLLANG